MDQSGSSLLQQIDIDACWKKTGIYGDRSCPKLPGHTHCRNCEVYTDAASALRDQFDIGDAADEPERAALLQAAPVAVSERALRYLLFRLDQQWFGLRSRYLHEVCLPLPVRYVPNSRSALLKGVCNVRGQLVPCLSLHQLLELTEPAASASRRMLVLNHASGPLVVTVDQIREIALLEPPRRDPHKFHAGSVLGQISTAAVQHQGLSLTLLDTEAVLALLLKELQ